MALTSGLKAFYKLDDTSDSSGNSFTLTNNGTTTFTAGIVGNAANTGATNTTKSLSTSSQLGLATNTADRTISCWVKVIGSQFEGAGNNCFVSIGYTDLAYYIMGTSSTTLGMGTLRPGVGNNEVTATHTISTSSFSHLVIKNTGTSGTAYINGTSVGTWTIVVAGSSGAAGTSIGKLQYSSNIWYASAIIDSVGVWDRALSDAEITTLYNGGAGLEYPFTVSSVNSNFLGFM